MTSPLLITGETPAKAPNPSPHPEFRKWRPELFAPLQTDAYPRVREGRSCALVAPTSSEKTLAVAAPLFEARRPAVFVLPFRALILDQSQELIHCRAVWHPRGQFQQGLGRHIYKRRRRRAARGLHPDHTG
ncbi:MAG: DEAD/DEAH box helicase [Anaerolineales bacterium]